MARKPYKPTHQVKARMIPIRVSDEDSEWLQRASQRFGMPISRLMREGARLYVRQLERKGEPRKEVNGSSKLVSEGFGQKS